MSANQQTFDSFDTDEITQTEFETDDQLLADTKDQPDVDVHGKIKTGDYINWSAVDAPEEPPEVEAVDDHFVTCIGRDGERYKIFPDPQTRANAHFYGDDGNQRPIDNLWIEGRSDN